MESLVGLIGNSVLANQGSPICPPGKQRWFKTEKNALVATPAATTCTRRFVLLLWIATSPALTSATDPCSSRRLVFLLWIAATARLTLGLLVASK